MNKRFCDVEECGKEAVEHGNNAEKFTDAMFYDDLLPGVKYVWGRVAVCNADLCADHLRSAKIELVKRLL